MEKTAQKIIDYFFTKGTSIGQPDYDFILSILKANKEKVKHDHEILVNTMLDKQKAERERILKAVNKLDEYFLTSMGFKDIDNPLSCPHIDKKEVLEII